MSVNNTQNKGFTLIEMLIFLSLLSVVSLLSIVFLTTTISSGNKTEAVKEARVNGSFAIGEIENRTRNGYNPICDVNGQWLEVTNNQGEKIRFECIGDTLTVNTSPLTNTNSAISDCLFVCELQGENTVVEASFVISKKGINLSVVESASIPYQTAILVKNRRN